jgi:hypothetical protein
MSDRSKPDHDVREVIATMVLGIAVVAIAWSSYQSSLWGGEQAKATTQAILQSNLSVDSFLESDGIRTSDQNQWNQYLADCLIEYEDGEFESIESFACEQLLESISPEGLVELDKWFASDVYFFPFDSDEYYDALYIDGPVELAASDEFTKLAGEANENGDRYQGASTILAIVLFFSGISLVIGWVRLRSTLLVGASLVLAASCAYLVSLPVA